jgi:hypothetical protein
METIDSGAKLAANALLVLRRELPGLFDSFVERPGLRGEICLGDFQKARALDYVGSPRKTLPEDAPRTTSPRIVPAL